MKTLKSFEGRTVILDENKIFVITVDHPERTHYRKGTLVHPISGIDGSSVPGYHFDKDYMTVCRVGATQAEFLGFKKTDLIELNVELLRHII